MQRFSSLVVSKSSAPEALLPSSADDCPAFFALASPDHTGTLSSFPRLMFSVLRSPPQFPPVLQLIILCGPLWSARPSGCLMLIHSQVMLPLCDEVGSWQL